MGGSPIRFLKRQRRYLPENQTQYWRRKAAWDGRQTREQAGTEKDKK